MNKPKIIFFGNGPLAENTLSVLQNSGCEVIFHAHEKADLAKVKTIKSLHKEAHGVLASFGVIIKNDILELFEPEGILNIHPSLLPKYRGPSPIETAILNGDNEFGVSVMKLVPEMDAGPIYHQESLSNLDVITDANSIRNNTTAKINMNTLPSKDDLYFTLANRGATWLAKHLNNLPNPVSQDDSKATFTQKFDKSMSPLDPQKKTATELNNQIRAFSGFPKSTYRFGDLDCIIIDAHVATPEETAKITENVYILYIQCYDKSVLIIDLIQPAGRKIMDARSFINGYLK